MTDAKLASIYRKRHPNEVAEILNYPQARKDVESIRTMFSKFKELVSINHDMSRIVFVGITLKNFSPLTLSDCVRLEPNIGLVLTELLSVTHRTINSYVKTAHVYYKGNKGFKRDVDNYSEEVG